jgi:hypothetical protein
LDTLKAELALDALEMALWSRRDGLSTALVHHSDRGNTQQFVMDSDYRTLASNDPLDGKVTFTITRLPNRSMHSTRKR